ncbi:hypothetical protein HCG49_18020 [Arenibacter sp. 6A1]|uniref:hypothetical protein n=1 Tax=Arenibacter sp. 6A1 TaxID=2720391 RepID=UPI00144626DF|nr:hypothetical protein [Arenibacter sp. 6A1]NKI28451.1 hypothetical protein [Arenibacter sp. 6A1]
MKKKNRQVIATFLLLLLFGVSIVSAQSRDLVVIDHANKQIPEVLSKLPSGVSISIAR